MASENASRIFGVPVEREVSLAQRRLCQGEIGVERGGALEHRDGDLGIGRSQTVLQSAQGMHVRVLGLGIGRTSDRQFPARLGPKLQFEHVHNRHEDAVFDGVQIREGLVDDPGPELARPLSVNEVEGQSNAVATALNGAGHREVGSEDSSGIARRPDRSCREFALGHHPQ